MRVVDHCPLTGFNLAPGGVAVVWCSGSSGLLSCSYGLTLPKLLGSTDEVCLVLIATVNPLMGKETVLEYSAELSGVCLFSEVIHTEVFMISSQILLVGEK